jgi:hypothetical protein
MHRHWVALILFATLAYACESGGSAVFEEIAREPDSKPDVGGPDLAEEVAHEEDVRDLLEPKDNWAFELFETIAPDLPWQPEPGEAGYPCESGDQCNEDSASRLGMESSAR